MNVQPGTYDVEAFIWDSVTHNEVVHSPKLIVEVLERMPFYNQVQLNSRWCVRKDGLPHAALPLAESRKS
jgi:hypothetical protein